MILFVLSRVQIGIVVFAGAVVALCGVTDYVDAIVPWVFDICDSIGWADIYKPLYNPEPMDTYAYRPLSVLILKLALLITGREPWLITFAHALILPVFGIVSARFLVAHGVASKIATAAAVSSLAVPSLLFSAWICVEFDLVGATVVLAAATILQSQWKQGASSSSRWKFWILAFIAMTIKETSALQLLAYLAACALVAYRDRRRWKVFGLYLVGLLICTAPMHFVPKATTTAFSLFGEGFHPIRIPAMFLHTSLQLVFAVSFCGLLLLFLGGVRQAATERTTKTVLVIGVLSLFLAAPVLRHYSHFEAIIFSDGIWSVMAAALLLSGVVLTFKGAHDAGIKTMLWTVVLTYLGYAAAPIVLRFARADVSARIFAACIPILHALAWTDGARVWKDVSAHIGYRLCGLILALGFALFVVSSATNTAVFHRTRLDVEGRAKAALAADIRMPCPALINTNPVQLLTTEELAVAGAKGLRECAWIQTTTTQPTSQMSIDSFAAAGGIQADKGQDVYLYVQTARSMMSPAVAPKLAGDFSWALDLMPEADDDLIAGYQRMIYEVPTDIQNLFTRDGVAIVDIRRPYFQLPMWWNELGARLIEGVPVIERFDYIATVQRIDARVPGFTPPGGRIRADSANRQRRAETAP